MASQHALTDCRDSQLVQGRGRPLNHRLDKLPQAIHSLATPNLQLDGVFAQGRAKFFPAEMGRGFLPGITSRSLPQ